MAMQDYGAVMTLGHRSLHQYGGGDEVASAVPSAYSIPQAGADGTLALGWLSGVLPLSALRSAMGGTFTVSATGMATSGVSGTTLFQRLGTTVMLTFPTITGASSATAFTLSGIPVSLAPTYDIGVGIMGQDSGTFVPAIALLSAQGSTIVLYNLISASTNAISWTPTGTKTVYGWTMIYLQ